MLGVIGSFNGQADLSVAVKVGADGFIIKANDPAYPDLVRQARDLGKPFLAGAWPNTTKTPREEAERFVGASIVDLINPRTPASLDIEHDKNRPPTEPKALAEWMWLWAEQIENLTGIPPVIYSLGFTRGGWWNLNIEPAGLDWSRWEFRVARWITAEHPPADCTKWPEFVKRFPERQPPIDWAGWQFSADGNGLGKALLGPNASQDLSVNVVKWEAWERWTT